MKKSNSSRDLILVAVIVIVILATAFISGCSCSCGGHRGSDENEMPESSEFTEPYTNTDDPQTIFDISEDETAEETTDAATADSDWTPPVSSPDDHDFSDGFGSDSAEGIELLD